MTDKLKTPLEIAANEYANDADFDRTDAYHGFISGAEWQKTHGEGYTKEDLWQCWLVGVSGLKKSALPAHKEEFEAWLKRGLKKDESTPPSPTQEQLDKEMIEFANVSLSEWRKGDQGELELIEEMRDALNGMDEIIRSNIAVLHPVEAKEYQKAKSAISKADQFLNNHK